MSMTPPPLPYFEAGRLGPSVDGALIAAVGLTALLVTGVLALGIRGSGYDSRLAWLRAAAFFTAALAIGLCSGVTRTLLDQPLWSPEQGSDPLWWTATGAYLLVIVIGYGVIWPLGTVHHGRPLRPVAVLVFGVLWGLAQSQIFLSLWAAIEGLELGRWWTAVITYIAIAAYNGPWHNLYWDHHVSPPHNIEAWNLRKVALVHTPNLLLTLGYLAWFGNLWVVVWMQTLALVLSSAFMHFPRPGDPGAPVPDPAA